jgi:mannosyltransferase OCH1-like enzyme
VLATHSLDLVFHLSLRDLFCRAALAAPWNSKVTFNRTAPIPMQLWQTSRTKELGTVAGVLQQTWAKQNPGMGIQLLDDAEAAAFIADCYGQEVAQLYAAYPLGVMRADFWRYAMLYARGGFYADVDTECLKPVQQWFPPWTHPREGAGSPVFVTQEGDKSQDGGSAAAGPEEQAAAEPGVAPVLGSIRYANLTWADCSFVAALENGVHMCQWVIASVSGHPILHATLHAALQSLEGGVQCAYEHMVHAHTGPGVWTEGIRNALGLPGHASAADIATAVWTDASVYQRAREMRACIVAADFWGGKQAQNANNKYSSSWKEGSPFGSWTKERQQLQKRTKAAYGGS